MSKKSHIHEVDSKEYIIKTYDIISHCESHVKCLTSKHSNWNKDKDTRIFSFVLIQEQLQSYLFAEILSVNLRDEKWYDDNNLGRSLPTDDKKEKFMDDRIYYFGEWTKSSIYLMFFAYVELTMRLIATSYDNASCNDSTISKLVNNLIDKLSLDLKYKELWKVFAYTRNTMHSGGIHNLKDITITYKEKDFEFKKKNPINFLAPDNLFFLLTEVIDFLKVIIMHNDISSIPEIQHPYADIDFVHVDE